MKQKSFLLKKQHKQRCAVLVIFMAVFIVISGCTNARAEDVSLIKDRQDTINNIENRSDEKAAEDNFSDTIENESVKKIEECIDHDPEINSTSEKNEKFVIISEKEYNLKTEELFLNNVSLKNEDIQKLIYFKNLKTLSIDLITSDNQIDLSILSKLDTVTTLYINGSYDDLGFLNGMTDLYDLYLSYFDCESIKTVNSNNSIKKLDISQSKISELSWISEFNSLTELNLSHFSCKDFSGIGQLNKLEILDMSFIEDYDVDLSFLNSLNSLKTFNYCMPHGTKNFDSIKGCTELVSLYVFADLDNFDFCPFLRCLEEFTFYSEDDKPYDLTPIMSCAELKKLELWCEYADEDMIMLKRVLNDCIIYEKNNQKY